MFENIRLVETRLESLKRYSPESNEVFRFTEILKDLFSNMAPEDIAEYEASKNKTLNIHEQRKKDAEDLKRMEQNKDSVSI